jgi:hypothetical protein
VFLATDPSVADISGEYFYRCRIAPSSAASRDPELARRLFDLSEEICGVKFS